MRKGELSDDEADAVTAANDAEPDREDEHLDAATGGSCGPEGPGPDGGDRGGRRGSGGPEAGPGPGPRPRPGRRETIAELRRRRERAKARADRDAKEREERLHSERTATKGTTPEGGWQLWTRNTKAAGHRVEAALAVAMDELKAERRAAGLERLTYGRLLADALVRVADKSMGVATPQGGPTRTAMGSVMRGMLTVDLSALRRRCLEGEETCEIAGFGTVSLATAREQLGDALLTLVLKDGVDVVNITRIGDFTDAQRDAIWARAGGMCEIPGCGATSGLEIDHDHERQFGGVSNIANGSLKCRTDHLDKTHGDRRLIGPPGRRAWVHLAELPWDPARDGPIPQDQIEHLLPPERARPPGPAPPGTRPPGARGAPPAPAPPAEPAEGEQLDLLSV